MKKILVVAIIILSISLVGCLSDISFEENEEPIDTEENNEIIEITEISETENSETEMNEEDTKTKFKVGEYVELENVVIVLNSIREDNTEFNKPKEGRVYKVANFTIYNKGTEPYKLESLFDFKLLTADNYLTESSMRYKEQYELEGVIFPKLFINGNVAFEFLEEEKMKEMKFYYKGSNGVEEIVFDVNDTVSQEENYVFNQELDYISDDKEILFKDDKKIIVNSFEKIDGNDDLVSYEGFKYIIVDLTIENLSGKEMELNSLLSYKLLDKEAGHFYSYFETMDKWKLNGILDIDEKVQDEIVFEVPEEENEFYLTLDNEITEEYEIIKLH